MLVQLVAERTGFHPVSPSVFRPRPNVDSALVAFQAHRSCRRTSVVSSAWSKRSFAHRRKRLANSLELAGVADRVSARRRRSRRIGRDRNVRAEELTPREFLAAHRGTAVRRAAAAAKINLALVVGPQTGRTSTSS